jgi:hypothetical protein
VLVGASVAVAVAVVIVVGAVVASVCWVEAIAACSPVGISIGMGTQLANMPAVMARTVRREVKRFDIRGILSMYRNFSRMQLQEGFSFQVYHGNTESTERGGYTAKVSAAFGVTHGVSGPPPDLLFQYQPSEESPPCGKETLRWESAATHYTGPTRSG